MSLQTDEKILDALDEKEDNLIRLSTGVVLCGKPANATALIQILASFPRPKPPEVHNATMGRIMENPDDPDYRSRVQAWQIEQGDSTLTAFILLGTELVSVPKGMCGPFPGKKETDWLEDFELLKLPMKPESKRWRYLTWVKTVACQTADDPKLIQEVVGRLSGVRKADVQAAHEFPGSEEAPR
jgi:hypothetical protein